MSALDPVTAAAARALAALDRRIGETADEKTIALTFVDRDLLAAIAPCLAEMGDTDKRRIMEALGKAVASTASQRGARNIQNASLGTIVGGALRIGTALGLKALGLGEVVKALDVILAMIGEGKHDEASGLLAQLSRALKG